jgi:hypothetical protein
MPPRTTDPYPISARLAPHLSRMSAYMVAWAHEAASDPSALDQRLPVRIMADGMRRLAHRS